MSSVKIVTIDYYMCNPVKDLDVCYSEFRGNEVRQVPVLQIFGSTREGVKTCLHIHGILPYIYIPYDGMESAAGMSYKLAAEIDKTLNISLGQATAKSCFVHNIVLVSGIPLYGYHEKEHQFFKIFFYNPMIVKKVCSLLENGAILGKRFQPHEAHINYVQQFMVDYNLQGMNYINLSHVMYRIDRENPKSLEHIPSQQILPVTVQRRSFCRLECDALARDIMNIEEVSSGQLAVNPGLVALWEDERQRRRNNELDSQVSFCLTQDRPQPKSTATHQLFKQKLHEKLIASSGHSDDSVSDQLDRSVYPAETPTDSELLNASVVLSNPLTTPSNQTITNASSVVMDQTDLQMWQLLEELRAAANDESVVDSSQEEQQPQDAELYTLLQQLREQVDVEEDSILSQTVVEQAASSSDDETEQNLSLPLAKEGEITENNEVDDDSVWEDSFWDENCKIPQVDAQYDTSSDETTELSELNTNPPNLNEKPTCNAAELFELNNNPPDLHEQMSQPTDSSDHSTQEAWITSNEESTETSDETSDSSLATRCSKIVTRSLQRVKDETKRKTVDSVVTISSTGSSSSNNEATTFRDKQKITKLIVRRRRRRRRLRLMLGDTEDQLNDPQVGSEPNPHIVRPPEGLATKVPSIDEIAEKFRRLECKVNRLEERLARFDSSGHGSQLDVPRQDTNDLDAITRAEDDATNGTHVPNSSIDGENSAQSNASNDKNNTRQDTNDLDAITRAEDDATNGTNVPNSSIDGENSNASNDKNNNNFTGTQNRNKIKGVAQINYPSNAPRISTAQINNPSSALRNSIDLPITTRSCTPQRNQSSLNIHIVDNPSNMPQPVQSPHSEYNIPEDTLLDFHTHNQTSTPSNVPSPGVNKERTPFLTHNKTSTPSNVTSPSVNKERTPFLTHNQTSTPSVNRTPAARLNTSDVATQTSDYGTSLAGQLNKATVVNLMRQLRKENAPAQDPSSSDEVILISEDEEANTPEPQDSHNTSMRWNVDGVGDTSTSSSNSSTEKLCRTTRSNALANRLKVAKFQEPIIISSDSDSTSDNILNPARKQTYKQSTAEEKLKTQSEKLPKELRVSLVPLECTRTPGKRKLGVKVIKPTSPTQLELYKTSDNPSNAEANKEHNTEEVTKKDKEKPVPKYTALTVAVSSHKSKINKESNKQVDEPKAKRAKIADEILCEEPSSQVTEMEVEDNGGGSGRLQMIDNMPVIQNTNSVTKPEHRLVNSNTNCDIISQSNSEPTSTVRQTNNTQSSKVKKQLFSATRKTIVVNINTDTNKTFVEEARVCSYGKSRLSKQKCVQIQQLKELVAKEDNFLNEIDQIYAQPDRHKMDDDVRPEALPPVDIFEPDSDNNSACDVSSNSAANSVQNKQLARYNQNKLSLAKYNGITSTSIDICCINDQPAVKTYLNTPFKCTDFDLPEKLRVIRPHSVERKYSNTVILFDTDHGLSAAQLYDLQCGFIPKPCTSLATEENVDCCVLERQYSEQDMTGTYDPDVFVYDCDKEQEAIMESIVDEFVRQKADVGDAECDGMPLVEESLVSGESLPFAPNKERVDSDVEFVEEDRVPFSQILSQVSMKEDDQEVEDFDMLQSRCISPDNNMHTSDPVKTQLFNYMDELMASNNSNVPLPEVNGEDDTIIEATPPKSQSFTVRQPAATGEKVLMPRYQPAANTTGEKVLAPKYQPPTRLDIINSLAEYNIPEVRYQQPFYSNVADVTGKMDVGHNVLKIPSNTILDVEEYKSCTGFPGLDTWRREKLKALYPDVDVSKINFHIAFAGQAEVAIAPGTDAPSCEEVEQWIAMRTQAASVTESPPTRVSRPRITIPLSPSGNLDDSMSETMTLTPFTPDVPSPASSQVLAESSQTTPQHSSSLLQRKATGNLQRRVLFSQTNKNISSSTNANQQLNFSDTSVYNNSHQITGINLDTNEFGQENLQQAKALSEPQNLTIMVVELYVRTRGELYPDPQYDAVRAIFYSILNDVPADVELPRDETGVLVVNTLDSSTDMSPGHLLDGSGVNCTVTYVQSESDLMTAFVKLIRKWDPDIFAGYEIEMHSWGYLIDRCNAIGINLASQISRLNPAVVKPRTNDTADNNGGSKDLQLVGRIVLDVWRLFRHEVALQSYTFENIMYQILHMRVPKFSYQRLTFFWEHARNFYRYITAKYYLLRVKGVLKLLDQLDLIGRTSELAKLFGIQFYEVLSRGSQFRVESMMLRLAKPLNYIPVSPSVQQRAKMRAPEFVPLIFEPESRFYVDPVIVLDFQSLYPSIIIAYNYCFSTCIGRVEMLGSNQPFEFGACQLKVPRATLRKLQHKLNFSPCGVGYVKPEVRQGILPRMLKEILETRLMVKSSMKENKDNKVLQRVLHSRQLGLKLIANVTYGYTAANFSGRMPCIEVGDSVVSKGRETLERAIKLIEQTPKWRAKVVYGDTDSLFVMVAGRSKDDAFRIGAEIAEAVTNDNPAPVKLKLEKVFLPCILQTKKRYVGYMYESAEQKEPEYCAKGIETVRRDGCPAVAKMLETTLRTLFEKRDMSLVKRYVCRQFSKLLTGRVSIQDLTFAREYRGASGYRPGACVPALELARKWAVTDKRREPRRGERVPYVIVNGPPGLPLIRLVRCPRELLADPSRLRPNAVYYITRVIAPALNRCFTLIGADILTWYNEMPRRQLQVLPTEDPHSEKIKKSTISQYFATMSCAVCGEQTRDGLCDACSKNPQHSLVVLYSKVNNWERTHDEVSLLCQSCCGRKQYTDCNSLDCPVLYRLNQVSRDLKQVPYVRKQIAKFDD